MSREHSIAIVAALQSPPHALLECRLELAFLPASKLTQDTLKAMEEDLSPLLAYFVDTTTQLKYERSKTKISWLLDMALVFNRRKKHIALAC